MTDDFALFHPERVITVDIESYFSDEEKISFKYLSTEEYVRHPRWLTHGIGIKNGYGDTHWIAHPKNVAKFFAAKQKQFEWCVMLAHNAKFDGLVLSHHYGVRPTGWVDTRSLAYMLFGNRLKSASLGALTEEFLPGEEKDQSDLFAIEGRRRLNEQEYEALGEYCKGDCDKTHMLYSMFYQMMEERA